MKQKTCLNCNAKIENNFCSNCGQKTDTHRITLKHFLMHDLLHGIWHLEKGILFTIKETFTRPGQAALDYITGKRIRYYNVFYLSLLVIALNLLLSHLYETLHTVKEKPIDDTIQVTQFFKNNLKSILLSIVPILGLNASFIFKRLKLNIAEHFILSGITLLGILMISVVFTFVNFVNGFDVPQWILFTEPIVFFMIPLFPAWVYYDATKNLYSFWGFLWRMLLFYFCALLVLLLLLSIIILTLTNGDGNFYINI